MRRNLLQLAGLAAVVLLVSCAGDVMRPTDAKDNALLADWTGPYGGVPAFDKMDLDALKPALEVGMAKNLEDIEAIADNPEPATFDNTIVAMERAGRDLNRVFTYWGIWNR